MATELNVTQNLSKMTLDLPTDTVTVQVVVKTLKGQYGICQNNNHRETTFNPWSEDLQPTESFMRIVRETQIKPDRYYLETCMRQTLSENYGHYDHAPKIRVHTPPQDHNEKESCIHSPCPSNWSDDLLEIIPNKDEDRNPTEDVLAHMGTTLRQSHTMPQALQIQEQNNTNHNGKPRQKTRPPYKTWNWKRSQKHDDKEQK